MLTVAEALAAVLKEVARSPATTMPLADALGLKTFALLGHSTGGMLATRLAAPRAAQVPARTQGAVEQRVDVLERLHRRPSDAPPRRAPAWAPPHGIRRRR